MTSTTSPAELTASLKALRSEVAQSNWSKTNLRAGLVCIPVITAWVFFGVVSGVHERAVLAVAGAVAVGFAAFQRLGERRLRAMFITLAGIAIYTWVGCVAGNFGWPWLVSALVVCGFVFGTMTMLGYGAWWVGLQWMIALLVYGSRPANPGAATWNSVYVLAGGFSQLLFVTALRPLTDHWFLRQERPPLDVTDPVLHALVSSLAPFSVAGRYGLRVALAMAIASTVHHVWKLPNGYWIPMTAAILLKPDLHETLIRGFNRMAGTIVGAGLTTALVALLRPSPAELGLMLLVAIWCCFAVQRVHYALFAVCITAYVVLMLSELGLPELEVAWHRVEATLAGAAIALVVHLVPVPVRLAKLTAEPVQ